MRKNLFVTLLIPLLSVVVLMMSSCSPSYYPMRGDYTTQNRVLETDASFEEVWANVVDYFAFENIPIQLMDKSSGLIVSKSVEVGSDLVTQENRDGQLQNPRAWFVLSYSSDFISANVRFSFNVRVKTLSNGKTLIAVNVGDIRYGRLVEPSPSEVWLGVDVRKTEMSSCASTGNFEKSLLELFSKKGR